MLDQLRTDDLLIRSKAAELLARARHDVVDAELAYRREHLPAPTRDKPFADPEALRQARRIQAVADELSAVAAAITSAPVPESDRMWERHRNETTTLAQLGEIDIELVEIAAAINESMCEGGHAWIIGHIDELSPALGALKGVLRRREGILHIAG